MSIPAHIRKFAAFVVVVSLAACVVSARVSAAQSNAAVSQGFQGSASDNSIVGGAIVSLKSGNSSVVTGADTQNANSMIGVVNTKATLALSASSSQVPVVIAGTTPVLVSDINGAVQTGDKITASPITGVGMKATTDAEVVGIAQQNFDAGAARGQAVTDRSGAAHTVHIGAITAQISVAYYIAPSNNILPPFLQNLANSIAGKPVSVVRILVACVLLLLASIGIFILLYTSIHSGIISIGRNPLAAHAINRGLATVGLTTLLILAFALVATYIILAI